MPTISMLAEPAGVHGTTYASWTLDLQPGQALLLGSDPDNPVVGDRWAGVREACRVVSRRRLHPLGRNPRVSRAQLAIAPDLFDTLRVFNLGRRENRVVLQPFGRTGVDLAVQPVPDQEALTLGTPLSYATTIWLPSTGEPHPRRRITVVHPDAHRDVPAASGSTYTEGPLRWPLPPRREEGFFALVAPLLRFPAESSVCQVATLSDRTLDRRADDFVRHDLKKTYTQIAWLGRNTRTVELLFDLGDLTLERLHERFHASPSPIVRDALRDAATLHRTLSR